MIRCCSAASSSRGDRRGRRPDRGLDLRRRLERRYRQALRIAAERSLDLGHYQKAIDLFHRLVALDITNLAAHSGIMRGHIQLGEPALAITQYRILTRALNDELGIDLDPDSEPEQIYRSILAG